MLLLWKLSMQRSALEGLGISFEAHSDANLYSMWTHHDYRLIPRDSGPDSPSYVAYGPEFIFDMRLDNRSGMDDHCVYRPDRANWERVRKLNSRSHFKEDSDKKTYGALIPLANGTLEGSVESARRGWWVDCSTTVSNRVRRHLVYNVWETAVKWVERIAPTLDELIPELGSDNDIGLCRSPPTRQWGRADCHLDNDSAGDLCTISLRLQRLRSQEDVISIIMKREDCPACQLPSVMSRSLSSRSCARDTGVRMWGVAFFCASCLNVYNTLRVEEVSPMSETLPGLEAQRSKVLRQITELGDLRPGSITGTIRRCGKPTCHCARASDPGHGPNLRLTFKTEGKTVTEALPTPSAVHKAEREIEEFRKFQKLSHSFVQLSEKICRLRPGEEDSAQPLTPQEKKRRMRSIGK